VHKSQLTITADKTPGKSFSTYLMVQSAAQIVLGQIEHMTIGYPDHVRDWGHADDGVHCMWLALQHPTADDYVLATGQGHTVREFVELALKTLKIDIR
jgi:GDPmannose 4,6-dehydratase